MVSTYVGTRRATEGTGRRQEMRGARALRFMGVSFGLVAWLLIALAESASGEVSLAGWMSQSSDDISGFTTLSGDNNQASVTLPFTFTVEGTNYTSLAISTNGWIEFDANSAGDTDPTNDCLPTSAHTNPFLAAYWDDLQTIGTNIRYGTVGTAPNRVFIADFLYDVDPAAESGSADDGGMQVQLHEGSNVITVKYRSTGAGALGASATVGFQGAGGGSATTVQPLSCNAKVLDDNNNEEGWSADVGRAGKVRLASLMAESYDDITGFTSLSGDNATATATIPFTGTIDGVGYTNAAISTNGWLEFGGNTAMDSSPANLCLPTATHTNPFLAFFWDDMETLSNNIRYGTVGTTPNRIFIVDFTLATVAFLSADEAHGQVQIHETSNLINIKYRDNDASPSDDQATGQYATIGFQGAGGASASSYPLTCDGKILDDNQFDKDGWSIHPLSTGGVSLHAVTAHSPDDINGTNIPGLLTLSGDNSTVNVTLPFNLEIDSVSYSSLTLSTNGWIV